MENKSKINVYLLYVIISVYYDVYYILRIKMFMIQGIQTFFLNFIVDLTSHFMGNGKPLSCAKQSKYLPF